MKWWCTFCAASKTGWIATACGWIPASFALNGNIRHKSDNKPLEQDKIGPALMAFFEEETARLDMIEGAATALEKLSTQGDIVMLTNLPSRFRDARIANLRSHGIEFPVVTNSGPKGPAIAGSGCNHTAPVVFIDDNNGYLKSAVRARAAHQHRPFHARRAIWPSRTARRSRSPPYRQLAGRPCPYQGCI
jgi:hypothetical protein